MQETGPTTKKGILNGFAQMLGLRVTEDVALTAMALMDLRERGFNFSGPGQEGLQYLHFQRYCASHVDIARMCTEPGERSIAQRFERNGFPWPEGHWPPAEREAVGDIVDVVQQVLEWPVS